MKKRDCCFRFTLNLHLARSSTPCHQLVNHHKRHKMSSSITSAVMTPFILVLVLSTTQGISINQEFEDCPSDCICYKEYLTSLEAWKWVEKDVNIQKDDPLHHDFNPYTEHNEVYDNPSLVKKRQQEEILDTATCMLRTNSSAGLEGSLSHLKSSIQVLSLIQAPGSGTISLKKSHLENLHSLIGLEISGYSVEDIKLHNGEPLLFIEADALSNLENLAYLSLQSVSFLQQPSDFDATERKFTYNSEFVEDEQIIIVKTRSKKEETIVPYSIYKSEPKISQHPVKPDIEVAFTKLPSLQHLRISDCNLQDISWDMFYKLDNLKFLLLENNDLLFLPDFVFYATPNLTTLSLSHNRILNLQTVGLAGLLSLQKLDVSYNNIAYLSELSLPPFPYLEVADFRHNLIEAIFPNTFEIMNSTKTLMLGSPTTPLEFSPNSFYGLISLTRLDITNAHIEFLEKAILKGMPELESLTITGTIPRIMYDAFSEVPKLEKLIMKQCGIKKISMDAFFGLTSLTELDLSHNELTFLPPGIFEQQVSLREIFLQYNNLQTLPPSVFSKIPAKLIRLEGNPWYCSCDMKYWDSKVTNKVKRYHIPPPNSSFCDPRFYKRSACYEAYEPKFEVKYVYEKRVSPVCQAPQAFQKRNVFEVLRKGLHFCANSLQQNISILLTSSNPTETLEIMGTVRVPVQTQSSKDIEKQLLFPPKIKKPRAETGLTTKMSTNVAVAMTEPVFPTLPTRSQTQPKSFTDFKTNSQFPTNSTIILLSTQSAELSANGDPRMETIIDADIDIDDDNSINVMGPSVSKAAEHFKGANNETRRGNDNLRTNNVLGRPIRKVSEKARLYKLERRERMLANKLKQMTQG